MKKLYTLALSAFALCIANTAFAQPSNDDVCNAIMITVDSDPVLFDNNLATAQTDEVVPPGGNCVVSWCDGNPAETSVWFTFVAPDNGAIFVTTCNEGTDIDTQLAIWSADDCLDFSTFTFIAANDDMPDECLNGGDPFSSEVTVDGLVPNTTYYIQIDGFDAAEGGIAINISTGIPVSNINFVHNSADEAVATIDLYVNGELVADDMDFMTCTGYLETLAGTVNVSIADAASVDDSNPLWSSYFTINAAYDYEVMITGIYSDSGYDPIIPLGVSIYEGARTQPEEFFSWDILFMNGSTDATELTFTVVSTSEVVADALGFGSYNSEGYANLPTANYSILVTDNDGLEIGTWCLPLSAFGGFGGVAITLTTSGFMLPSANSDGLPFNLFLVDYFEGEFLELMPGACPVPVNDSPCDAIEIIVDAPPVTFDNSFATGEEGEIMPPNLDLGDPEADCINAWCDGTAPANSLWFKFVAPASGVVAVNTCFDVTFDTQVGVYGVGDCGQWNSFDLVAANDDADGGCGKGDTYASAFFVPGLTAGTTYHVQVDGWGGSTNDFDIQITEIVVSVSENEQQLFTLYPNPTDGLLQVNSQSNETHQLTITDVAGRTVLTTNVSGNSTLDLSALGAGMYTVEISTGLSTERSRIIVK